MRTGKRRNAHKITFARPEGKKLQETQAQIENDSPSSLLSDGICIQGGSNMTGTDLCVNKPHCAAAVRP